MMNEGVVFDVVDTVEVWAVILNIVLVNFWNLGLMSFPSLKHDFER